MSDETRVTYFYVPTKNNRLLRQNSSLETKLMLTGNWIFIVTIVFDNRQIMHALNFYMNLRFLFLTR